MAPIDFMGKGHAASVVSGKSIGARRREGGSIVGNGVPQTTRLGERIT